MNHHFATLAVALLATSAVAQSPPPPPPVYDAYDGLEGVDLSTPPDFEGVLEDSDPRQQGKPYDAYAIAATDGNEVTVTMTSTLFDTYLIVKSPSGREWSNDDFGSTSVSQVTFNAPETGSYTIWATAFGDTGRGAYEVRVTEATATVVALESGRLDYDDEQLIKGEYYDSFTVTAPSSGEFFVELMPLGFSPFMRVTAPSGATQSTDLYGYYNADQRSARLGPFEGERGTWKVEITTGSPGEVGAYDVRVIQMDER